MVGDISESAPIVVGGSGGSGTRAVVKFLIRSGVDMGETNPVGDALAFTGLLDRHIDPVLRLTASTRYNPDDLPAALRESVIADYLKAAREHQEKGNLQTPWGFKNPRHIFLLPLLNAALPNAKFVHVVRDGRDMLLSENVRQPRTNFEAVFGRPFSDSHDDIARFWSRTNVETRRFGLSVLVGRYVCVRIEDLFGTNRVAHIRNLAEVLGVNPDRAERRERVFQDRESYGRGRAATFELAPETRREFEAALFEFGYMPQ